MFGTGLAVVNATLALLWGVYSLRYIRKANARACWLKALSAALGFYFFAMYVFVALTEPGQFMDPVLFGLVFVRPANTLMLGLMAAGAAYRWWSHDD